MKSVLITLSAGFLVSVTGLSALAEEPAVSALALPAGPTGSYTITLHGREACVTPHAQKLARSDGGFIDVSMPNPAGMSVLMTGTTAANSYLGCTGAASEIFHLVQEFEISCSNPRVKTVQLTLDSSLVGFVRSKGRAVASVRRADVRVLPANWDGTPLAQSYPCLSVEGTQGRLCNQHLPPIEGPPMPLGRYTLVADLILESRASGLCDSHAVADFSPDTTLPAEWIRTRDPFQGVAKKSFGFNVALSAASPAAESKDFATLSRTRLELPAGERLRAPIPPPVVYPLIRTARTRGASS